MLTETTTKSKCAGGRIERVGNAECGRATEARASIQNTGQNFYVDGGWIETGGFVDKEVWMEFKLPHSTECLQLDDETVSNPWATIFMIAPAHQSFRMCPFQNVSMEPCSL